MSLYRIVDLSSWLFSGSGDPMRGTLVVIVSLGVFYDQVSNLPDSRGLYERI